MLDPRWQQKFSYGRHVFRSPSFLVRSSIHTPVLNSHSLKGHQIAMFSFPTCICPASAQLFTQLQHPFSDCSAKRSTNYSLFNGNCTFLRSGVVDMDYFKPAMVVGRIGCMAGTPAWK